MDALHAYQQGLTAALGQEGQPQQPPGEAERAIGLLNSSAAACLGFGAYESARAYASLALRRAPGDAAALLHLAKALDGLGRYCRCAGWDAGVAGQGGWHFSHTATLPHCLANGTSPILPP